MADEPTTTTLGFYSLNGVRALAATLLGYDLKLTEEQRELLAEYGPTPSSPRYESGAGPH